MARMMVSRLYRESPESEDYLSVYKVGEQDTNRDSDSDDVPASWSQRLRSFAAKGEFRGHPSLVIQPKLCYRCSQNQELKLGELNTQESSIEFVSDEQIKSRQERLDLKYCLCHGCHEVVQRHLKLQDRVLRTSLLGSHLNYTKTQSPVSVKSPSTSVYHLAIQLLNAAVSVLMIIPLFLDKETSCETSFIWENYHGFLKFANFKDFFMATSSWKMTGRDILSSFSGFSFNHLHCITDAVQRWYGGVLLAVLCLHLFLMFSSRKMRIDIITLACWMLLQAVVTLWCSPRETCKTLKIVCVTYLSLVLCTTVYLLYLYVFPRRRDKRKRLRFSPDQLSYSLSDSQLSSSDFSILDQTNTEPEEKPPLYKENFDWSLSAMTLSSNSCHERMALRRGNSPVQGHSWRSREMFHRTSTPVMDGMCGPLVSRQERPLILPARLNVSSPLRPNCTPSATPRGQFTRRDPVPDSATDSMDEQETKEIQLKVKRKRPTRNHIQTAENFTLQRPYLTRIKRAILSVNTVLVVLVLSISLNGYFIFTYTDSVLKLRHFLAKVLETSRFRRYFIPE